MHENLYISENSRTFAAAKQGRPVNWFDLYRGVEQLVARQAHNLEVACSSLASATQKPSKSWASFVLLRQDSSHAPGRSSSQSEASLWAERESCLRNSESPTRCRASLLLVMMKPSNRWASFCSIICVLLRSRLLRQIHRDRRRSLRHDLRHDAPRRLPIRYCRDLRRSSCDS